MKISKPEYLKKALLLSANEQERVLSRMTGKLPRRLEKAKLSVDEALAIQLEIEDEQLNDWRKKMHSLKETSKKENKAKAEEKTKAAVKPKASPKEKTAVKAEVKAPAKPPAAAKPKVPAKAKAS